MTEPTNISPLRELIEARKREQAERTATENTKVTFDADLIPEPAYERSDQDREIDDILSRVGILDAYNRWCGKSTPKPRPGQTESIKISCPLPGHTDRVSSAWLNTDENVFYCGRCEQGGDIFDIAAVHFGITDYKTGANFHRLREKMVESMGYTLSKTVGGATVVTEIETEIFDPEDGGPEPDKSDKSDVPDHSEISGLAPENTVTYLFVDDESIPTPTLDWRAIVPAGTFLDTYMQATTIDEVPEEYHFWAGMVALGLAVGRDVLLADRTPIYSNLFVCSIGKSGTGKSRATRHLTGLLQKALPFDPAADEPKGARRVSSPASAEALISAFQKTYSDPIDPKRTFEAPIRGFVDFPELSGLIARSSRMGSTLKPHLLDFYDCPEIVETVALTTGRKRAYRPFVSVISTTQPESLRYLLSRSDDAAGFLNRWLFVAGNPKESFLFNDEEADISPAVPQLQSIRGWSGSFMAGDRVTVDAVARKIGSEFYRDVIAVDKTRGDTDIYSRMDLTFKKLLLLFAINDKSRVINESIINRAIECYYYLRICYGLPEREVDRTIERDISDAITVSVKKLDPRGDKGASLRDIQRLLARRKFSSKELLGVIKVMTALGELDERIIKPKTGRPTTRYFHVA